MPVWSISRVWPPAASTGHSSRLDKDLVDQVFEKELDILLQLTSNVISPRAAGVGLDFKKTLATAAPVHAMIIQTWLRPRPGPAKTNPGSDGNHRKYPSGMAFSAPHRFSLGVLAGPVGRVSPPHRPLLRRSHPTEIDPKSNDIRRPPHERQDRTIEQVRCGFLIGWCRDVALS